jgi:8-oxo-dGTP diphosphatase
VGEPAETEEAAPLWFPIAAMPYHEMWADDEMWFPLLLAGTPFRGHFLFDGDTMLTHEIITPTV